MQTSPQQSLPTPQGKTAPLLFVQILLFGDCDALPCKRLRSDKSELSSAARSGSAQAPFEQISSDAAQAATAAKATATVKRAIDN